MKDIEIKIIDSIDDPLDDNVDIQVNVGDSRYFATFFTLNNLKTIFERHKITGEDLSGRYFWSSNMIIVEKLDEQGITDIVNEMISTGEIDNAFEKSL